MLEGFVLIFHRALQPVLRVQIHHNAALVETMVAFRKMLLVFPLFLIIKRHARHVKEVFTEKPAIV
jgi:hypothetical protein